MDDVRFMYGARVHSRLSFHLNFCCCRRLLLCTCGCVRHSVHIAVYRYQRAHRTQIVLFLFFFIIFLGSSSVQSFFSNHFTLIVSTRFRLGSLHQPHNILASLSIIARDDDNGHDHDDDDEAFLLLIRVRKLFIQKNEYNSGSFGALGVCVCVCVCERLAFL